MGETCKRAQVRQETGWFGKYLAGSGIDIGCGNDPVTQDCRRWDMLDGDAQAMENVPDASFDWVYSSHCLEHMVDPTIALANWWRILRPQGYLIVLVPDEDLYEQGLWPSHLNTDHKSTWTIYKTKSWSPVSRNLVEELGKLPGGVIESLNRYDDDYDYSLQQGVEVHYSVPKDLQSDVVAGKNVSIQQLRCLGFWPIDQGWTKAQISLEGIVRKL